MRGAPEEREGLEAQVAGQAKPVLEVLPARQAVAVYRGRRAKKESPASAFPAA